MAVVSVSHDSVCLFAGWAFDKLLRELKPRLLPGTPVIAAITNAEQTRVGLLDLEGLDPVELRAFAHVLRDYYRDLRERGASSMSSPEFFPGYLASVGQLLELVESAIAPS